jgi:hypothetical protein
VSIPPHLLPVVRQHLSDHAEWGKDGLLFPASTAGTWATAMVTPPRKWRFDINTSQRAEMPSLRADFRN